MEKVYFHPERIKMESIPVFTDYYHYEAICYFLQLIECLEPNFIKDLEHIIPNYTETEKLHEKYRTSERSFIDNWNIFENANRNCNPHLINLKDALIQWAKKYNLTDEALSNKTFLEIALWALPSRRDHEQDIQEREEFYTKLDRVMPQGLKEWSITNSIYCEDEIDDERNKDGNVFNEKDFPFVFTPSSENIHQYNITGHEVTACDYESLLVNYDLDVFFALKGEKEKIHGFTFGYGWDPRMYTWSEFEKKLDVAYAQYKELYKKRIEEHIKQKGYIEGKEKRNRAHFEWLVRYQIQNWSIKEIADYYSQKDKIIGEDTVRKALVSTSSLLQLNLRR